MKRRDWSHYDGPGARYFQQEEVPFPHVDDPLEPFNRVISVANYAGQAYLFAPIALAYRSIVPRLKCW